MYVADDLLGGNPDFVLDCIDNLETKVGVSSPLIRLACIDLVLLAGE